MDKEDRIFREIKRRAQENVRYGKIVIELKIHDGMIISGEIVEERIKVG